MNDIKKQLLSANKSNNLLKVIYDIYLKNLNNKESLFQEIISLHNDNNIDILDEFLTLNGKSNDFCIFKSIFEDILPDINAPINETMGCVLHIFNESKSNSSGITIFSSFTKYCKKDEFKVEQTLQIIDSDIRWHKFIPSVIEAGSGFNFDKYVKIAIKFTKHSNTDVCKEAVYSLGVLQYKNYPASLNKGFKTIKNIIETTPNSKALSASINAIFELSIFDNTLEYETMRLIEIALKDADDNVLYAASRLCYSYKEKLPIKLFKILLHSLEDVNYKNQKTIINITNSLPYLLKNNQKNTAITYLEKALIKNTKLPIKSFRFLLRDLHEEHNDLLNQTVTKWFISGNINLCRAVMDIIGFFGDEKIILLADISQLKKQNKMIHLLVIRKVIGWLFNYQISSVRFIISMIEVLDRDNIKEVENLLFDPFLVSYPTYVKGYLESIKKPMPKTKKVISGLLKKFEKYHNDLNSAWDIKELQPSQEQRESHLRLHSRQISRAMQESKKDSLISLIATEFTILYGRRFILYHLGTRQEMNHQKFEHSVVIPNLEFVNPHVLDYMLCIYKYERFRK